MLNDIAGLSKALSDSIDSDSNKLTAAMGLAGPAIAEASGLAQSNQKEE